LWLIFAGGLIGTIIAINLPLTQDVSSIVVDVDDVSSSEILAPSDYSYASEVLTEQARQDAANAVPNYYDPPDSQVARQQLGRLQAVLTVIDSDRVELRETGTPREQIVEEITSLENLQLDEETANLILALQDNRWLAVKLEAESVHQQVMRDEIREDRLDEARRTVPAFVGISTSPLRVRRLSIAAMW